jgi:hypothetical protein
MSAKVGTVIYKMLSASGAVVDAVGSRIFPNVAPLQVAQTFPYIVYKVIATEPTNTKGNLASWSPAVGGHQDRISPLDVIQVQVSIFSVNYKENADLAHNCRLALDRKIGSGFSMNGIDVDSLIFDSEVNMYEKDIKPEGVYHIAQTYEIRVINTWVASI